MPFNSDTIHRQVAVDKSADNRNHKSQIQIDSGKWEQFESEKQDTEAQSQHDADNTAQPTVVTYAIVMGNNSNEKSFSAETINKDSNSFLSELIINENQSFVSDRLRKDDTAAANAKQTRDTH